MSRNITMVSSRPAPTKDTISFPILTYTNALPRNDLRTLDNVRLYKGVDEGTATRWDLERPRTSDGPASRKPPQGQGASFDFQVTAPPDEAIPSSSRPHRGPTDQRTTGLALGSPGMSNAKLPPPRLDKPNYTPEKTSQISSSEKPSKWKKIGALFRAKNALVQTDKVKQPPSNKIPAEKSRAKTRTKRNDQGSKSNRKDSQSANVKSGDSWPLLQVDIPDFQMERYSVMFSDVVNKNEQPSLLARRSKTLDRLHVPDAHEFLKTKNLPVAQRRATSPAGTSFILFPTSQPPKAARVLGTQNFSCGPRPPQTLPVESPFESPKQACVSTNANNVSSSESLPTSALLSDQSLTPQSSGKPLLATKPELHPTQANKHQMHTSRSRRLQQNESNRPGPRMQVQPDPRPIPPAKDNFSSTSLATISPLNLNDRIISPTSESKPRSSHADSTRMPLVDSPRPLDSSEISPTSPTVSIARSISMSRGKHQTLVPIAARVDHLNPNGRFVDRKTLTPKITNVQDGRRKAVSQELQIESV